MSAAALPEGIPILCRDCGGHAALQPDSSLLCPYCGTRDALPPDELDRALEIRRRLALAESRAAHLRGFDAALGHAFEDPAAFLRVMGVYLVVALLLLGASGVNLVVAVLPAVGHATPGALFAMVLGQAIGPLFLLAIALTLGAALLTGRVHYRRRMRPLLLARPPSRADAPCACRVCGGELPPTRATSVSCHYCNATNLVPRELQTGLGATLQQEADDARRQLQQASAATLSIAGAMRRTLLGCGALIVVFGGALLLLMRLALG